MQALIVALIAAQMYIPLVVYVWFLRRRFRNAMDQLDSQSRDCLILRSYREVMGQGSGKIRDALGDITLNGDERSERIAYIVQTMLEILTNIETSKGLPVDGRPTEFGKEAGRVN